MVPRRAAGNRLGSSLYIRQVRTIFDKFKPGDKVYGGGTYYEIVAQEVAEKLSTNGTRVAADDE